MLRTFITIVLPLALLAVMSSRTNAQFHRVVTPQRACNVSCYPTGPTAGRYLPNAVANIYPASAIGNFYGTAQNGGCYPVWPTFGYPVLGAPVLGLGGPCAWGSSYRSYSSIYSGGSFYFGGDPLLNAGIFSTSTNDQSPAPTTSLSAATAVAEVDLVVPADSRLWVQDIQMQQQTGTVRLFVSPALPTGREFRYRVRATYQDQGREMTTTRMLTVRAGERLQVDLLTLPAAAESSLAAQR
jgi:uncharacterized protein (TIGR03000 family)